MMIPSVFNICFLTVLASTVAALGPAAVNLRTAGNFAILAKSGITIVPPCMITGNVGVGSINGLTGFPLTLASNGEYYTSSQVVGEMLAPSCAPPTPVTLTIAFGDMGTAFTDAAGRVNPNFVNLDAGAIGGLILLPGLYKWGSGVSIGSDVTISGAATDTWIFQIAGTLSIAAGAKMVLSGGAVASNIVWVVSGAVTADAASHIEGVVLGKTSISLLTRASANSRLLAQTDVVLQEATVNN
ncbi:antifreeze protein [Mycena galericulata]|nr:antifreeze protein [Mycena galericulata]